MHETLQGESEGVDKVDRRPRDEVRRGQAKRGTIIGTKGRRKGGYTTIGSVHVNHYGSMTGTGGSGENEGSRKDIEIDTGTTVIRGSVGN